MAKHQVVVVGGGTGTSVLLSGLKTNPDLALTAVVVVSDSGGSTGRLRDEFGFVPVGDVRQCLAALASGEYSQQVRDVLLYRFGAGKGLKGHNLGNLILTALEDMSSSPGKAIETASNIFNVQGTVLPVSETSVDLVIHYQDGTMKIGEHHLDDESLGGKKIVALSIQPEAEIYHKAQQALLEADMIVLGPGDLYGSILANAVIPGFTQALQQSSAQFVYVVNLMTHYSQTHSMSAQDHVDEVVKYTRRQPDVVVVNSGQIPEDMAQLYAEQQEFPVTDDLSLESAAQIIRQDLVDTRSYQQSEHDRVDRSLLRHHRQKLADLISELVKG